MNIYLTFKNILRKYRNINECEIDYETAKNILQANKEGILLDVRSTQEYKEEHECLNFGRIRKRKK